MMAYNPTNTTRHSILPSSHNLQSSQSSALQSRINAKRSELANLKQLQDLSAQMATQMSALEGKLATLKDGTEAVACILANWENVLKAISMASTKATDVAGSEIREGELPVTLVRIPVRESEEGDG